MASTTRPWAIIAGVGPGAGAAIAHKFAQRYGVALLARRKDYVNSLASEIESNGGTAIGLAADSADEVSIKRAVEALKEKMNGSYLAAAIYNVGGTLNVKPFLELSVKEFETGWSANGRGAFLFSQQTIPLLLKAVGTSSLPPTLIFTSATAALKGSAKFAQFSTGKFAMRSLSQSLAREFSSQGVHVAHVIMDGLIDTDATKDVKYDVPEAKITPQDIADNYWYLHNQPRSGFTAELDIRPWSEKW